MTDLEKFIALYKSVGINLKPQRADRGGLNIVELILVVNETEKTSGDNGCETYIVFDENGKFIGQSIYE